MLDDECEAVGGGETGVLGGNLPQYSFVHMM
jgi:hypothetical protein